MKKILATLLACALVGCSPMLWTNGIPNYATLDSHIWRGGHPTQEGWLWLHQHGVRWVIDLHWEDEDSDAYAEAIGMHVFRFGMAPGRISDTFGAPSLNELKEIADVVASIRAAFPDDVIYIHCFHGQDRTGLVSGALRIWLFHWKWDDAYAEAKQHHFHPALLGLRLRWRDLR